VVIGLLMFKICTTLLWCWTNWNCLYC